MEESISPALKPDINMEPSVCPLLDVQSFVSSNGRFVKSDSEVDNFIRKFGIASQTDLEWMGNPIRPTPYIAEVNNVVVLPGSRILLDEEGNAHCDEMEMAYRRFSLRPKHWDMEITTGPRLHFPTKPVSVESIPCGIHLTGEHEANYFHWVGEILPRMFLIKYLLPDNDDPLLISDGLHQNLYDLLEIVSGAGRRVIRLDPLMYYRVNRLIYPSDVSRILDFYDRAPSQDTTYLSVGLIKAMADEVKSSLSHASALGHNKLFVKRLSNYRMLLNEPEIEALLVQNGFVSIDPGILSIREQVGLFSQADIIVGPSGAAMTNILWCHEGAEVYILHSDHPFKKYPYWDAFSRMSKVNVTYIAGPRAHQVTGLFEAHDDYRVSLDDLKVAIGGSFKE